MVKKGLNMKVLKELGNGYSIKMSRNFNEVKRGKMLVRVLESSNIGVYLGSKLKQGDFKNAEEAERWFGLNLM